MTYCSELACISLNKGKPTHLHMFNSITEPGAALQSHADTGSCHGPCGLTYIPLRPPGEGRSTYFIVLELAQGPDSSKMPTRTSPVWQTLHNLLNSDCSLLCRRRAAHCWWGVWNPGTPVILHKAREHIEKLQWLVAI